MEVNKGNPHQNPKAEQDYEANKHDPDPAPEAIEEKDDKPAGQTIKWAIAIAVAILIIIYLVFYL